MSNPWSEFKPGFTIYSTAGEALKRSHCEFCGRELGPHSAVSSGVCDSPECHARKIAKVGAELAARRRQELEKRMQGILANVSSEVETALAGLDASRDQASVTVTPWQGRPVESLPAARRAAFRAHLEDYTARAFAETDDPAEVADPADREKNEEPEPGVVAGACGTCQGHCCARGGDTALLVTSDMVRYRRRHPGAEPEDVVEAYLAYLPVQSTRGGCVYQAADGCALPRDMRHDICNAYYCPSLRWLNRDYMEKRTGKVVFVATDDEDRPRQVSAFDTQGGLRPVAELAPDDAAGPAAESPPGNGHSE